MAGNSNQHGQQRTNVKITIFDRKDSSLNTNIKKPFLQITLTDVKTHIRQKWRNFRESPPKLQDYTYSAKTIDEDGRDIFDIIENDFDIIPSFFDVKTRDNKIEIRCVS